MRRYSAIRSRSCARAPARSAARAAARERDQQRRLGADPQPAVDHPVSLAECLHAVPGPRLRHTLASACAAGAWSCESTAPAARRRRRASTRRRGRAAGELAHRLPVAGDGGQHASRRCLRREPVLPGGDDQAGRQPLDVPLERPGQGLVEVVDVEDQPALGRAEQAEVRQVRVAAHLHGQPGRVGEVAGHRQGRAPVEGEGGLQHPPVADRHQFRQRVAACSSSRATGSGRSAGGSNTACVSRGTRARAALPRAARSAGVRRLLGVELIPAWGPGWCFRRLCRHDRLLSAMLSTMPRRALLPHPSLGEADGPGRAISCSRVS